MKLIKPHQHKLDYYTFFDDPNLFYSLISAWMRHSKKYGVEESFSKKGNKSFKINQPIFYGNDTFDFRSKYGMTYRKEGEEYKRNFEYEIKLRSLDNMKSFYISFSPEISKYHYGKHKTYGDYQPFKLKKKVQGVDVRVNSVNIDYEVGQIILKEVMKILEVDKFFQNQRLDLGVIRQCEYYIRYNSKYERKVGQIIQDMHQVIGFCGTHQTKTNCDVRNFEYYLYSLRSNRFSELGFFTNDDKWNFALKTYRAREHQKFNEDHPLHYPKLEVYFDEELKDKYPDLKDFYKIQQTMFQILANIIKWADIEDKDGYIQDAYFDNEKFIEIEFIEAKEMFEKLKNFYSSLMPGVKKDCYKSSGMLDYYNCVLLEGNPNYDQLVSSTGFSKEWIRKITSNLKDLKIIKRMRSTKSFIQFHSQKIVDIVRSIVKTFEFDFDMNDKSRKERKKKRIEARERARERAREKASERARIKHTVMDEQYIKKRYVRLIHKVGGVDKVNGGIYKLQNIDFLDKKPKNYEKLLRDYG